MTREEATKSGLILHRKLGYCDVEIYNTTIGKWENKLKFKSIHQRDRFWSDLPRENKVMVGEEIEDDISSSEWRM